MGSRDELTEDELAEIKEIFDHFDTNNNGVIESHEFGSMLRALDENISEDEIAAGVRELDDNHNGVIDFDEFLEWWADR